MHNKLPLTHAASRLRQVSAGQVGDVCAHETWRSSSCSRKLSEAQSELESVLRRFCRLLSESASLFRDSDKNQVSEYEHVRHTLMYIRPTCQHSSIRPYSCNATQTAIRGHSCRWKTPQAGFNPSVAQDSQHRIHHKAACQSGTPRPYRSHPNHPPNS